MLSSQSKLTATTGEVVNIMSNDVQHLVDIMPLISFIWSAPLQIVLATIFLWDELGPAVISGVALMILLVVVNAFLARVQKTFQVINFAIKIHSNLNDKCRTSM